jgi:hypothetical protein
MLSMKTIRPVLAAFALGAITFVFAAPATADTSTLTVTLSAQNGSGETGKATLTQETAGVSVVIALTPAADPQPAHIHTGTCSKLNPAPQYPLANVVGGSSTTLVKGVTIAALLKTPFAINVHKSANDLGTYVACGNIAATAM